MITLNQFFKKPTFTNSKGECLPLPEISRKNVKSITIIYLSAEKRREQIGILGFFGFFSDVQEKKEVVIADGRILLYFFGNQTATIYFSSPEEYQKIEDYDENSLWKEPVRSASNLFQINFPKSSLKEIDWV